MVESLGETTMVAPVTGPFTTAVHTEVLWDDKTGYKQAKPIDQGLPYTRNVSRRLFKIGTLTGSTELAGSNWRALTPRATTPASNLAYDRLKDKIRSDAGLGVTLAEYKQSLAMIEQRSLQLWRFARKLNRFDFPGAFAELRLSAVPKRVSTKKSFANNFLEAHFGWIPLVGDIQDSLDIWTHPIQPKEVSANGKGRFYYKAGIDNGGGFYEWQEAWGLGICKQGCQVRINNPNLALAEQLGLVNPLVFVYERTPFSFVLNWFVNIEQFLSQGTDFMGLSILNAYTVKFSTGLWEDRQGNPFDTPSKKSARYEETAVQRSLGLTGPTLRVRPWKVPSWTRAATAASLLVQQLTK
jgi:hypothetical protein